MRSYRCNDTFVKMYYPQFSKLELQKKLNVYRRETNKLASYITSLFKYVYTLKRTGDKPLHGNIECLYIIYNNNQHVTD